MTKEKDSLGKRLAYYIKNKGLNKTQFTKLVKMDYAQLHRIIKGESEPGMETLRKILNSFPDLSLNWLVSGKGTINEPTLEEMEELASLHSLTTERDLNPFYCINNYLEEQFEWQSLKLKIREKGIHEEPLRDRLTCALLELQIERREFDWLSNQGPRDLTPSITKSIEDFIYFSENSRSHYIHTKHTEKNGITD
jgi:transcriptional regulator with XRE-family HTH domain